MGKLVRSKRVLIIGYANRTREMGFARMYFSIMKKYYFMDNKESYQGTEILILKTKRFQFKWFTDCGSWFIYLVFGKKEKSKWIRFSDCGTMSNFIKRFR